MATLAMRAAWCGNDPPPRPHRKDEGVRIASEGIDGGDADLGQPSGRSGLAQCRSTSPERPCTTSTSWARSESTRRWHTWCAAGRCRGGTRSPPCRAPAWPMRVWVIDQWGAVVGHNSHGRLPAHAEGRGHVDHRVAVLSDSSRPSARVGDPYGLDGPSPAPRFIPTRRARIPTIRRANPVRDNL